MAQFEDLRQWIEQAKEIGELEIIEGADPKLEIGAIAQITAKNRGPANLHQKIKGYPSNFMLITNLMCNVKTFNLIFGFPLGNSIKDTVQMMRKKVAEWERDAGKFPVSVVSQAPILENVVEGAKIDLRIFPAPLWHELDGGPYIGTADSWITRDPDTGQVNCGTYRGQLHDHQTVGMMITHGHHGRLHREIYFKRGEPCPAVLVVSQDPLLFAISASSIPRDMCKLNYVGAIKGEPVPVIKGRVTGLPIPANAEIAIEGFAEPNVTKNEGCFGEWQGYYAGGVTEQPIFKAVTLYYRNSPILTGAPPAKPPYNDITLFRCILLSALIWNEIEAAGVPGVKSVWLPEAGSTHYLQVASIKQQYGGHATHAGHAVAHSRSGAFAGRYTIVVDDDIDPFDLQDVIWAVCTRSLPTDTDIIKKSWGSHSEPMFNRRFVTGTIDSTPPRAIIYAVKPYEWREDFAPVNIASEHLRKEVSPNGKIS